MQLATLLFIITFMMKKACLNYPNVVQNPYKEN